MKGRFILDYLDENNFKKLERSLRLGLQLLTKRRGI